MARPRKPGHRDLPPGLYLYKGRDAYIKMPGMRKALTLDGVRDRETARGLYKRFMGKWQPTQAAPKAEKLLTKLDTVAAGGDVDLTVAGYAKTWREKHLPKLVKKDGNFIGDKTRADYESMLKHQVEKDESFKKLALANVRTKDVRRFLAKWISNPKYYNNFKSLLSRMFADAIAEAHLDENPVADVARRPVAKREVYISMEHYLEITKHLAEWEARACDLIYLISHRPGDVLRLKDQAPHVRYEKRRGRKVVIVSFTASKNDQAMEIVDHVDTEGGIETTLQWFREWKEKQDLRLVKHFICYPKTSRRRSIGKPISVDYLSRRFAEASARAGLAGKYTPRDLRKKGLTDEARIAGKATNKGGHKTQLMREYYVVGGLPQRHKNQLTVLRHQETQK